MEELGTGRNPSPNLPTGYAQIAYLMALYPEMTIVRRFGYLNSLNFLRLQAQLSDLLVQLRDQQRADSESGDQIRQTFSISFQEMATARDTDSLQYDTMEALGRALAEYAAAVQQKAFFDRLSKPTRREIDSLGSVLTQQGILTEENWLTENREDLVVLAERDHDDRITRSVRGGLLAIFHRVVQVFKRGSPWTVPGTDLSAYAEDKLSLASRILSSVIAAIVPTVGLLALTKIPSKAMCLLFIGGYAIAFSALLAVLTSAKQTDVFILMVSWMTVAVVFVTN
ncbi:hypothetical protein ASPCAL03445 [Aspergillus calidoustus]|uniref:DUF6594 domain-containing protein n=1 Tax=Aspergillus calidoustus TaxID=454130 RepID=A0A0U5FRW5_ASPCI|nr:hypothetical protein ASPCAL03445 [Aspergillus calidoustus]